MHPCWWYTYPKYLGSKCLYTYTVILSRIRSCFLENSRILYNTAANRMWKLKTINLTDRSLHQEVASVLLLTQHNFCHDFSSLMPVTSTLFSSIIYLVSLFLFHRKDLGCRYSEVPSFFLHAQTQLKCCYKIFFDNCSNKNTTDIELGGLPSHWGLENLYLPLSM